MMTQPPIDGEEAQGDGGATEEDGAVKPASYAPMYCAMYPRLAEIVRSHGYALAVHGTLQRDMDLTCIPWVESPSDSVDVVKAITSEFHIRTIGEPDITFHGRERWTISVGFGECFIDLSFMPRIAPSPPTKRKATSGRAASRRQ